MCDVAFHVESDRKLGGLRFERIILWAGFGTTFPALLSIRVPVDGSVSNYTTTAASFNKPVSTRRGWQLRLVIDSSLGSLGTSSRQQLMLITEQPHSPEGHLHGLE